MATQASRSSEAPSIFAAVPTPQRLNGPIISGSCRAGGRERSPAARDLRRPGAGKNASFVAPGGDLALIPSVMRILTPYLAIAALVAPASLSAESFEGKVTMQMTGRGGTAQEVSYTMKGSRVLIGIGTMAGVIMDRDKNEITVLMPQQRMYMVRPMPQVPANPQAPNGAPNDVSFQETGVTEKILGYTCTKYLVKSKGSTTELWVTDQLGSFAGFGPGMGGGRPGGGRGSLPQPWEQGLRGHR